MRQGGPGGCLAGMPQQQPGQHCRMGQGVNAQVNAPPKQHPHSPPVTAAHLHRNLLVNDSGVQLAVRLADGHLLKEDGTESAGLMGQ